jgi:hypothetical protein
MQAAMSDGCRPAIADSRLGTRNRPQFGELPQREFSIVAIRANALIEGHFSAERPIGNGKRRCGQRWRKVAAHLQRSSIDEFKLTHSRV